MRTGTMPRSAPVALALVLCALLAACSMDEMLLRIATPEGDRFAREVVAQLRRGDSASAGRRLSPNLLKVPGVRDSLAGLARHFPRGPVRELKLVNAQVLVQQGLTIRHLTYQERSAGGVAVIEVRVLEDDMSYRYLDGVHVAQRAAALSDENAFTFAGKGPLHTSFLLLACALPLFCLWAAVRVARTPMPARWLWALLALVAAGGATFNWTTGELSISLLSVQLMGAGILRSGAAGPWLLSVAFPVGAVIALARRRRFLERTD